MIGTSAIIAVIKILTIASLNGKCKLKVSPITTKKSIITNPHHLKPWRVCESLSIQTKIDVGLYMNGGLSMDPRIVSCFFRGP